VCVCVCVQFSTWSTHPQLARLARVGDVPLTACSVSRAVTEHVSQVS